MHFLPWIFSQYPLDVNSFGNNPAKRKKYLHKDCLLHAFLCNNNCIFLLENWTNFQETDLGLRGFIIHQLACFCKPWEIFKVNLNITIFFLKIRNLRVHHFSVPVFNTLKLLTNLKIVLLLSFNG